MTVRIVVLKLYSLYIVVNEWKIYCLLTYIIRSELQAILNEYSFLTDVFINSGLICISGLTQVYFTLTIACTILLEENDLYGQNCTNPMASRVQEIQTDQGSLLRE